MDGGEVVRIVDECIIVEKFLEFLNIFNIFVIAEGYLYHICCDDFGVIKPFGFLSQLFFTYGT